MDPRQDFPGRILWSLVPIGIGLGIALFVLSSPLSPSFAPAPAAAQDGATEVGAPTTGFIGFEIVGRVDQDGESFTSYGYLMHISGLTQSALFTDPLSPTESTARFTYFATSTLTARSVISNLFVIDTVGPLTIYYNENPSGSFDDPSSFASGTAIATASVRFHDVLNVQAPNQGIAQGVAELTQNSATPFEIDGQQYRLGSTGVLQRLEVTGQGTRTEATIPRSVTALAGHSIMVGRRTMAPVVLNGESN